MLHVETQTGFNFPVANEELTFWSVTGQRMATYRLSPGSYSGPSVSFSTTATSNAGSNVILAASIEGITVGQLVIANWVPPNSLVTGVSMINVGSLTVRMSANATLTNLSSAPVSFGAGPSLIATQTGTWYYLGGKLIKNASGYVGADRLGSIGKYYPYGQERPSATQNGTEKFTGYLRDSETGLDYADQRYYQPGMGRFLTADPYMANNGGPGDPASPSSWNRYTYVAGDPINSNDREGLYLNGNPGSGPFMGGEGPDPTDPGVGGPGGFGGGIGGLIRVCGYVSRSTPRFAPGKSGLSAGSTERVGGSGSVTPGSSTPLPPICNNATAVAFAKNYLTDLQQIADDLQIPVAWVLAGSAGESA